MSDRTGRAIGTLSPVIYFENSTGRIVIPGYDTGKPEQARRVYEGRFQKLGYEWKEAGTLADVDRLQNRMADQMIREQRPGLDRMSQDREYIRSQVASSLRQRMVSSSTTPYEREFIELYLKLRDEKKDKYRDSFEHRNMYLNIRENGENKQIQDFCPDHPEDFWRSEAQQK